MMRSRISVRIERLIFQFFLPSPEKLRNQLFMTLPIKLSPREHEIMEIVYALEKATLTEIQSRMENPPTRAALRSLLTILESKGHLAHGKEGGNSPITRHAAARAWAGRRCGGCWRCFSMVLCARRCRRIFRILTEKSPPVRSRSSKPCWRPRAARAGANPPSAPKPDPDHSQQIRRSPFEESRLLQALCSKRPLHCPARWR